MPKETISPASTVIPLRDVEGSGLEIYMTQRSPRLKVLGGYYVFPGGTLDPQDSDQIAISRCRGITPNEAKRLLACEAPPEKCIAHWVAGIRELFEEAGILLACNRKGEIPDFNVRRVRKRYDKYRKLIQKGEIDMNLMMTKTRLRYATDTLLYFSHWITPPGPWKRFDTRFFVAPVPLSQRTRFHKDEVQEGVWLSPNEALEKARTKEWPMIPPTIITLKTIARYNSIAELSASLAG